MLFLGLMPAAHTKTLCVCILTLFVSFETYSKIIQQCDFILCDPKCKTVWELNEPFALMHHEDRTDGVKLPERKAGHSFLAVHGPLIS